MIDDGSFILETIRIYLWRWI